MKGGGGVHGGHIQPRTRYHYHYRPYTGIEPTTAHIQSMVKKIVATNDLIHVRCQYNITQPGV